MPRWAEALGPGPPLPLIEGCGAAPVGDFFFCGQAGTELSGRVCRKPLPSGQPIREGAISHRFPTNSCHVAGTAQWGPFRSSRIQVTV